MADVLAAAAEALRQSARKPGLPTPTKEHQDKTRGVVVRKIRIAARRSSR